MRLRAGPEHMPNSAVFMAGLLGVYLIVGLTYLSIGTIPLSTALTLTLIEAAGVSSLVAGLLAIKAFPARIVRTLTAVYGTGILFSLMAMPLAFLNTFENAAQITIGGLLGLLLLGWSLAVFAHVLRRALELGMGGGFAIAVVYWLCIMRVYAWFLQPLLTESAT